MQSKIFDINRCKFLIKNYCAKSDRCQFQVMEKLKQYGLSNYLCEEILIELIAENYVNEQRFAQSFCSGKFKIKKWGKRKIFFELKKLKVSDQCIKIGLLEIDDEDYISTLKNLVSNKRSILKDKNSFVKKKKIADYAIRKGYESDLVWDSIRQLI